MRGQEAADNNELRMETVDCDLCGSVQSEFVYAVPDLIYKKDQLFNVMRCGACGLGFVNPRPVFEQMPAFYPSTFYDYFDKEHEYHAKRYATEAKIVEDALGSRGRLLDVGCANGDFPRYMMSRGWNVEGVE